MYYFDLNTLAFSSQQFEEVGLLNIKIECNMIRVKFCLQRSSNSIYSVTSDLFWYEEKEISRQDHINHRTKWALDHLTSGAAILLLLKILMHMIALFMQFSFVHIGCLN